MKKIVFIIIILVFISFGIFTIVFANELYKPSRNEIENKKKAEEYCSMNVFLKNECSYSQLLVEDFSDRVDKKCYIDSFKKLCTILNDIEYYEIEKNKNEISLYKIDTDLYQDETVTYVTVLSNNCIFIYTSVGSHASNATYKKYYTMSDDDYNKLITGIKEIIADGELYNFDTKK